MKDKEDHVKIVNNFVEKTIEEACSKSVRLLRLTPCINNNRASRNVLRIVLDSLKFNGTDLDPEHANHQKYLKDEIADMMMHDLSLIEPPKPEEALEEYKLVMKSLMRIAEEDITTFLHKHVNTCTEPKPTEKDIIDLIIQHIYTVPFSSTESKVRCFVVKARYISYYDDWYDRYNNAIKEFSESCHQYAETRAKEIWENAKLDDNPFLPFLKR